MIPRDIHILAMTVHGEARSEGLEGRIAVAWVIRNRSAKTRDSLARTCLLSTHFSCWNNARQNDPNQLAMLTADLDQREYAWSMIAALKVAHGLVSDPTGGATHYHANYIDPPDWAFDPKTKERKPFVTIGRHLFYRNVD